MVDRLREHHLVGHPLLRPLEVRSRHGGLGAERADEVSDAIENEISWLPHDGARGLILEVLPDVLGSPPGVHARCRPGSLCSFLHCLFLIMIGGEF